MKRILLYGIIITTTFSCGTKSKYDFSNKIGLYSKKWQTDSIGCLRYRERYADTILAYTERFISLDKEEVLSFLGTANFEQKKEGGNQVYSYIIERSLLCNTNNGYPKISNIEASTIYFLFDDRDKLISMGKTIP